MSNSTRKSTSQEKKLEVAMKTLEQHPQLASLLGNHRKGFLIVDLAVDIAKTLQGVRRSGKKGSVTVKFEFIPDKADPSQITLIDDISCKVPKPNVAASKMFIGDENMPVFDDPAQMELNEIDEDVREVREIE